ncbi:MAG: hypothetical protein Q9214_005351 [Letrouitia sp. 1 TL-2023]
MADELILITGGTGYVGSACLLHALRAGYRVRVSIRADDQAQKLKSAPWALDYLSNIDFVIVEDITKEGAFDSALQDVNYVLHIASPTPGPSATEPFEDNVVRPAIDGTLSILKSASQTASIRKMVITSSVSIIVDQDLEKAYDETTITTLNPQPPYPSVHEAYHASKVGAFQATNSFLTSSPPHFPIVFLLPSFVLGPHPLATTPTDLSFPACSTSVLLAPLIGQGIPFPIAGNTVHIDDVARIHIAVLNEKKVGTNDLIVLDSGGVEWDSAKEIVRRRFTEEVERGLLPCEGAAETKKYKVNSAKGRELFGNWKGWEEQVEDTVNQYLELVEQENKE